MLLSVYNHDELKEYLHKRELKSLKLFRERFQKQHFQQVGLLPLLLATGAGSEVQRPLASVVVFGLATSTLLTLFVIPVVYGGLENKKWVMTRTEDFF